MLETNIRPVFQRVFIQPLVHTFVQHIDPNIITLLSLLTGILSAVLLCFNMVIFSIVMLLLSGYLDILDGAVARNKNISTNFGTVLDILSDRTVESVMIIALFIHNPKLVLVCLFMFFSILLCVSSFLLVGVFSEKEGDKSFYYSPGLIERAETFIFFIAIMLFPKISILLGIIFIVLVFWTTFYRVYQFYRQN